MFGKIKIENIAVSGDGDKLVFSYILNNEEQIIKAAGRISLERVPKISLTERGFSAEGNWTLDKEHHLILGVTAEKGISFGFVKEAFEAMVS